MEFSWDYKEKEKKLLRSFLKEQGISKSLLAKIKFQGGQIMVNGTEVNVLFTLAQDDKVTVVIPDEGEHETLLLDPAPIDIVFEDEHLLVVNKPYGVSSIPAQYHPNGTMANRVKAYYKRQGYKDQVVHAVTRLDRDTSGLMLFAKHGFAHSKLDVQLRQKRFGKKYLALAGGNIEVLKDHDMIDLPIARDLTSLMNRKVDPAGKPALTEYWLKGKGKKIALADIKLHTGRTHQIRVHFSAIGCPLAGDDMYGGALDLGVTRQALHCYELRFAHPFTGEALHFCIPPAEDMADLIEKMNEF